MISTLLFDAGVYLAEASWPASQPHSAAQSIGF